MLIEEKQLQELTDSILTVKSALETGGKKNDAALEKMGVLETSLATMRQELSDVRKLGLSSRAHQSALRPGEVVSEQCAKWLGSYWVCSMEKQGKLLVEAPAGKDLLLQRAFANLGIQSKAALTTSDIPVPIDYSGQIVELVWKYGQARQYGTVMPLGAATVNLPQLTTDPAFGYIAASGAVAEKSPQIAWVTFTASKWGGLVRYPSEIDADSIVPLGQFFARYVARQMAKLEDTVFFTADGTVTYNSITGLLGQEITLGNKIVTATGNTSPDKITLANMRSLRGKVSSSALFNSAYYMNATMENLLTSFNTSATVTPYVTSKGPGMPATLDGFPIHWVDVMPVYGTAATINANQVGFGDASYHYLGVRAGLDIALSRDVFFANDQWALRALQRFTTGLMANNAFATLALAAS